MTRENKHTHSMHDSSELDALLNLAAREAIRYRRSIDTRPQAPQATFAEMRAAFAEPVPEHGAPAAAVIEDLAARAEPGLATMTGPRFFGWVIGASHPVGVAADWLTSAWGQNSGNPHAAASAAAAEDVAARWLVDLLDLPRHASVGFTTGATMASFTCLAAARNAQLRKAGWDVEAQGLFGAPPISVLIGEDAHATVFSALQFLGLGRERVVRIRTDAAGRMNAAAFGQAIDASDGPTIAIAQAGQLNSGAFDPFPQLTEATQRKGAWLHVDGAFGLWARACPAHAHLTEGIDRADSWAVDGHKWLQTPYDCGYAIVADAEAHRRAMTLTASYLPQSLAGEYDPTHYVPELSRRARGFATWAVIKHLGRDGIADLVERHCSIARQMAEQLAAEPGINILNEVELNQIMVRFGGDRSPDEGDRLTREVIARIQRDGVCFAGGADWHGRWIMRLSVISWYTTEEDGARSVAAIIDAWRRVRETL